MGHVRVAHTLPCIPHVTREAPGAGLSHRPGLATGANVLASGGIHDSVPGHHDRTARREGKTKAAKAAKIVSGKDGGGCSWSSAVWDSAAAPTTCDEQSRLRLRGAVRAMPTSTDPQSVWP